MARRRVNTKQTIPSSNKVVRQAHLRSDLRRLYHAIHTARLRVELGRCRDPHHEGYIVHDDDGRGARMRIDPFWNAVSVFVHEIFHHLDPEDHEDRILERENLVAHNASPRQMRRLFRHLQRLWLKTMEEDRTRGRRVRPCLLCGQEIAPDILAAAAATGDHHRATRRGTKKEGQRCKRTLRIN